MLRLGKIVRLVWPALVAGVLALACSPKPADQLRDSVEVYWQAQKEGRWHECYRALSPAMLERLEKNDPMFSDVSTYAKKRESQRRRNPLEEARILSFDLQPDREIGFARIGTRVRGRGVKVVNQRWTYDGSRKRWLISPFKAEDIALQNSPK